MTLTHDVIFDVILPPLLFEAAISIPWSELQARTAAGAGARHARRRALRRRRRGGIDDAARLAASAPALAFGALIAATDPIAVIALLRETGVKGRLRLVIESESLINDGVAALLFTLVVASLGAAASAPTPLGVLGADAADRRRRSRRRPRRRRRSRSCSPGAPSDHLVETALTAVAAYGSFLIAEHIGASGVLATVAAGLLMGNLGVLADEADRFALTSQGRAFVVAFWEFAAFVANSLVFLLIGLALAATPTRARSRALAVVVALALAGRAAAVYPICAALRALALGDSAGPSSIFCGGRACAARWRWPSRSRCRPRRPTATKFSSRAFGVVAFSVAGAGPHREAGAARCG